MTIELRPLAHADYEAYLERVAELDAVHREALPRVFRAVPAGEPIRTRASFEQLLADDAALLLGAWDAAQLAGYAHAILRVIEERWLRVGRTFVELDNLAVGASWRRRGLGLALVEAVERWGRERGATELELGVWEANAGAVAFYERLGFQTRRRHMGRPL